MQLRVQATLCTDVQMDGRQTDTRAPMRVITTTAAQQEENNMHYNNMHCKVQTRACQRNWLVCVHNSCARPCDVASVCTAYRKERMRPQYFYWPFPTTSRFIFIYYGLTIVWS